jgi:hypothetical protein
METIILTTDAVTDVRATVQTDDDQHFRGGVYKDLEQITK